MGCLLYLAWSSPATAPIGIYVLLRVAGHHRQNLLASTQPRQVRSTSPQQRDIMRYICSSFLCRYSLALSSQVCPISICRIQLSDFTAPLSVHVGGLLVRCSDVEENTWRQHATHRNVDGQSRKAHSSSQPCVTYALRTLSARQDSTNYCSARFRIHPSLVRRRYASNLGNGQLGH